MDRQHVVIGSRRSKLALWQTHHVIDLLKQAYPGLNAEVKIISTKGDEVLDKSLPAIGGKGLFTEALEDALRKNEIDIAVHSLKDLPTEDAPELTVGAVPVRAPVEDVLVSRGGLSLDELPEGAVIGTSSRRRQAQLLAYRSDLKLIDIRGNVPTRIEKALDEHGHYDATVLARAGIERLELTAHVSEVLPLNVMLPAPGQGALGIQCRDDTESKEFLSSLFHQDTWLAVTAERQFLNTLEAGCSAPVAAYAFVDGDRVQMTGRVSMPDGQRTIEAQDSAPLEEARALGERMAKAAFEQGAADILEAVR